MPIVKNLQKNVKQKNRLALTLIAILISASFYLLMTLFHQQEKVAEIIDVSGLQRMYSQKIAMLAQSHVVALKSGSFNEGVSQSLAQTAIAFKNNQTYLLQLLTIQDKYGLLAIDIAPMLVTEDLNSQVNIYSESALSLSQTKSVNEALPMINSIFAPTRVEELLVDLNAVVQFLEQDSHDKIAELQLICLIIWIGAIVSLWGIYWWLFRPMNQKIAENYVELLSSQKLNEEFKFAINQHAIVYRININGDITYVNQKFIDFYHYSESEALNQSVFLICADSYKKEDYEDIFKVCVKHEYWRGESINKVKGGQEFWFETTIVPLKDDNNRIESFIVMQTDINGIKQTELALNQLHQITSEVDKSIDEKIQQLLKLGSQVFNLPLAIISEVNGSEYKVLYCQVPDNGISPGDTFDLENTYCVHTLTANEPIAFHHAGQSRIRHHPCYKGFGLESYIGVPLYVDGKCFGTLNFSGPDVGLKPYTERELDLVQLFANWLSLELMRLKHQEELISQQVLLQHMGEQARIGAWEVNLITGNVYWSKVVREIHEVSDDYQPSLDTAINFYKEGENRSRIERLVSKTMDDGEFYETELQLITAKGNEIWVSARGKAELKHGECIRLFGSFQDITDRVSAQKTIHDTNDRLELVLQSTGVGVWDWMMTTNTVDINERWANMLGFTLDELLPVTKKSWLARIHPEDIPLLDEKLQEYYQGNDEFYLGEFRIRHKKGHWVWVFNTGKAVEFDDNHNPQRMIGTMIDITKQKEAEMQIIQANQRMKIAADDAGFGIWEYDIINDVLKWDAWLCKLYGIKPADFDQKISTWANGIHPDDLVRTIEGLQLAIAENNKFKTQFRIIWPNGEVRHIKASGIVIQNTKGKTISIIGTNYDVTSLVENEQALISAKVLAESAVKAKNEFLASMSHEIRTPMNGVIGMLSLLNETTLTNEQAHRVVIAKESANSLLALINDILDFSKIDANKLELENIEFDLTQMVGDFSKAIALQAQSKGLELILDLVDVKENMVKGDPSRIRQILTNLVSNAIKFTKKGEVILRVSLASFTQHQWQLSLEVIDSGIGISKDKQGKLFTAFSQLDASTTRQYGGTGLGLAIVKKLCECMSGSIELKNDTTKGSHFISKLIIDKVEVGESREPIESFSDIVHQANILVIDSHLANGKIIQRQLQHWQLNVKLASTEAEALQVYERQKGLNQPFDLIIVSYDMFATCGRKIFASQKSDFSEVETKIVLMTPMSANVAQKDLVELDVAHYFTKPATISDLKLAVKVLDSNGEDHQVSHPQVAVDKVKGHLYGWPEKTKILLVEDNRVNQMVAQGVLQKLGLKCDTAVNGVEALSILNASEDDAPYSFIFMDCQMPEMDGYQATNEIRQAKAGERYVSIPIVAMTANAMVGDQEKCIAAGMDDYLSKPINKDKVIEVLQRFLMP
ncbi:PAS domain-containing protein [Thalassotalea piscium]